MDKLLQASDAQRHCEQSEAIQGHSVMLLGGRLLDCFAALEMTARGAS